MKYNKKYPTLLLAVLFASVAVLSSFAGNRKAATVKLSEKQISAEDKRRADYFFLEAMCRQNAEDYASAFDLLTHCLEINPQAAEAYFFRAMYYSMLKNDSLALQDLEKAVSLNPDNTTYLEQAAQFYIGEKNFGKAIDTYEQLASRHRDRTDVLNVLVKLYQQESNYGKMIETICRIEQIEGTSEEIVLSKMQVYEMMGDKKAAFKALKSLADDHPYDLNYKVMMGNWLMQNNKPKEAFKLFMNAEKEEPDNVYVQSSIYDYYQEMGQDSMANRYMERILVSPKTESQSKMTMMRQLIQDSKQAEGDSTRVLGLFNKILAANPQDAGIAELKAAYMNLKKMPVDSVNNAMRYVLSIAPDNAAVRLRLIQALWDEKNLDEVISLSKPATEYNPEEVVFYYLQGLAYYQKDEKDKALEVFRSGVRVAGADSDHDMVSEMYASIGYIMQDKGLRKESYAAYDSCLQWKPDNIEALNNYAYYLSVAGDSLRKAEQMSYRTVKAEPKNHLFLDTYAWILFKQERYVEAKIYIGQAIACNTDTVPSAVVLEHAGDIYACLNDTDKALEYWKQALAAGVDSPMLPEKIKQKKYIKE